MNIRKWARLMLAATALLAGCKNFWQNPNTGTTPTCTTDCPTTTSGNFYILNQETNQIAGFNIVSGTTLTSISGSPYALSAKPFSLTLAPGGGYLYVGTAAGIYMYTINSSTGALTIGNGGGVISSDLASAMKMDTTGTWLVEAGPDLSQVQAVAIDSTTGLLSTNVEQHVALPAASVEQLTISPDNANVFIALGAEGTVRIPFNSANTNPFGTTITRIPVKNSKGQSMSVAVDPNSRLFYVGETLGNSAGNAGGLRVFNYASLTTTLTEISGSPLASGSLAPNAILPDSSGDYVYVANGNGTSAGSVQPFTIGTSTTSGTTVYSLTAGTAAAAGVTPVGLAEDSSNTYVLAIALGGNPDLAVFSFDATTLGNLDSVLTHSTGTDPVEASAIAAAQ